MRRRPGAALAAVGLLVAMPTCGGGGGDATKPETVRTVEAAPESPVDAVPPASCPPGLESCRSARGRIVYVERVDPDGDGDAHFVIADPQGITLKGLTVIDVRRGLRPHPLPRPGDVISAAGPVQEGSYGQSQIHALELHVSRP